MKTLADYGRNVYSQHGEDGMIEEIFRRIGEGTHRCVEFGASDGFNCSNTAHLWHDSIWQAILVESDPDRYQSLAQNRNGRARTLSFFVRPTGEHSVDAFVKEADWEGVDFISIDVDGDDYFIWEAMELEPRVVSIEYNRSVPPHVSLRQAELGDSFGQSAAALVELGKRKGYSLIGLTKCNLFFVRSEEAKAFSDLERSLSKLFHYEDLSYLVTDQQGGAACLGTPPWGLAGAYLGRTLGPPLQAVGGATVERIRSEFEAAHGPALHIGLDWHNVSVPTGRAPEALTDVLRLQPPLVTVDVTQVGDKRATAWMEGIAVRTGYRCYRTGPVVAFVRKEKP